MPQDNLKNRLQKSWPKKKFQGIMAHTGTRMYYFKKIQIDKKIYFKIQV